MINNLLYFNVCLYTLLDIKKPADHKEEKKEKRKKTAIKPVKFNKKWFVANYDKLCLIPELNKFDGIEEKKVYSHFFSGRKNMSTNDTYFEIVNNEYIKSSNIYNPAEIPEFEN